MAYNKTITDANTYYGGSNHVRAYDWDRYTTEERTGALAQAKREIEMFVGRDVRNPVASDRFRDDYAIFEQALFLLDQTVRTKESANSAQVVETVDQNERDQYYGVTIAPAAMRFLAMKRVRFTNG